MGIFGDSEENNVDQKGSVLTNITFTKTVSEYGNEMVILLGIIAGIKVFEVIIFTYKSFRRNMKKKFVNKDKNEMV